MLTFECLPMRRADDAPFIASLLSHLLPHTSSPHSATVIDAEQSHATMQLSPSSAQSAPSPGLTDTSAIDQYLDLDSFLDQSPSSASPAGTTPLFADAFNTLGRPSDPSALDASELFK